MGEFKWEVSADDTVTAKVGLFGRKKVFLNGTLIEKVSGRMSKAFPLSDQRKAQLVTSHGVVQAGVDLYVDGQLTYKTVAGQSRLCPSCSVTARPYDQFCGSCGGALPSAESQQIGKKVRDASKAIGALAILFVVSGGFIAAKQWSAAQDALKNLAQYQAEDMWSEPVNGRVVSVGELRELVMTEPRDVFLINLLLAAVMTGLYFWARRSPLPAVLLAAATYLAVQVLSAIADPASIGNGLILKLVIIAVLYQGIKAGFQQRAIQA